MRIAVVRHGHAVSKRGWATDDALRPLTARGRHQGEALVKLFDTEADRLISSPALRCTQTLEPLARHCGLELQVSAALARGAGIAAADLVRAVASAASDRSTVVLCTHREVIIDALPSLAADAGVPLGHRLPGAKGGTWLLEVRRGRLRHVRYQPAA